MKDETHSIIYFGFLDLYFSCYAQSISVTVGSDGNKHEELIELPESMDYAVDVC